MDEGVVAARRHHRVGGVVVVGVGVVPDRRASRRGRGRPVRGRAAVQRVRASGHSCSKRQRFSPIDEDAQRRLGVEARRRVRAASGRGSALRGRARRPRRRARNRPGRRCARRCRWCHGPMTRRWAARGFGRRAVRDHAGEMLEGRAGIGVVPAADVERGDVIDGQVLARREASARSRRTPGGRAIRDTTGCRVPEAAICRRPVAGATTGRSFRAASVRGATARPVRTAHETLRPCANAPPT